MEFKMSLSRDCLFFCLLFYSANCDDDLPRNVVVIAGADKMLTCAVGEPFRWYRYLPYDPTDDKVLFMGTRMADNIDERFQVLKKPESFPYQRLDLLITDVQANHFGTYRCKQPQSSFCAELIVLDSEPKCEAQQVRRGIQETEEMIELKCSVNLTENGEPEMLFRYKNDTTTRSTNCSARYNGIVVCVAEIPADQLQGEDTCSIRIKHKPIRVYTTCNHASNRPDYQYTWSSSSSLSSLSCAIVPDNGACAFRSTASDELPFLNLLLFVGFPTLGVLVVVLFVTVVILTCRGRQKKDPRYQKRLSKRSNEIPSADYAVLNISPYEEIPERPEALYCTANPAVLAALYSEVTQAHQLHGYNTGSLSISP